MTIREEFQFGRLVGRYDEDSTPRTATFWNGDGAVIATREYTAEENTRCDTRIAHEADRETIKKIIIELAAEKARAEEVLASTSASVDDKKVARAIKRTADAIIDLARFTKDIY